MSNELDTNVFIGLVEFDSEHVIILVHLVSHLGTVHDLIGGGSCLSSAVSLEQVNHHSSTCISDDGVKVLDESLHDLIDGVKLESSVSFLFGLLDSLGQGVFDFTLINGEEQANKELDELNNLFTVSDRVWTLSNGIDVNKLDDIKENFMVMEVVIQLLLWLWSQRMQSLVGLLRLDGADLRDQLFTCEKLLVGLLEGQPHVVQRLEEDFLFHFSPNLVPFTM
ncbi:hypothetical protein WICPIJ_004042 [Wickerhamomyces pijperi]|uniref:Uncharacterized protein n=1 Tax=Wickerhamomyces pijperi TaxID=599730 RepID=A0A9P8TNB1_WICPI|nr:hypothetical protein WICPIJ_004042 [Wickerhamomyces pijperi]